MSSQDWHTFLSTDLSVPEKGVLGKDLTKVAMCCQNILNMLVPKSSIYPEVQTRSTVKQLLVWQGKEYPSGVLPPEDVVQQILWELYELNFIYELQSLDRHACGDLDLSDTALYLNGKQRFQDAFLSARLDMSLSHQKIVDWLLMT